MELQNELKDAVKYMDTDPKVFAREIKKVLDKYPNERERINDFLSKHTEQAIKEADEQMEYLKIKIQLEPIYKKINLAYIAERYFKKSKQWLSQRLNNNIVKGRRVSFTKEEVEIFNNALKEYGNEIASFQIKI